MEDVQEFQTEGIKRVCIYLSPTKYTYLKQISSRNFDNNISETLLNFISKHLKYLYKIKQSHLKKTMTTTYQPKTKEYKKYWIYVEPTLWAKLTHLRMYLGYSISFIIRILIDWEMQEENPDYTSSIIVFKPSLDPEEELQLPHSLLHNYDMVNMVDLKDQRVFMKFVDYFY